MFFLFSVPPNEIYPRWFVTGSTTGSPLTDLETSSDQLTTSKQYLSISTEKDGESSAEDELVTTESTTTESETITWSTTTESAATTVLSVIRNITAVVQEDILNPLVASLGTEVVKTDILPEQGSFVSSSVPVTTSTVTSILVEPKKQDSCVCKVSVDTSKSTMSALTETIIEQSQWPAAIAVVLILWLVCRFFSKQVNKWYFRAIFETTKARLAGNLILFLF